MTVDEMIAGVEAAGLQVIRPRDHPDEQLRRYWDTATCALRIAQDLIHDGAKLHVTTPFPNMADQSIIGLMRSNVTGHVNAVLDTAVVERDEREVPAHAAE